MMTNLTHTKMSEKTSEYPVVGENPGLDEEAVNTLRSARGNLPAETAGTQAIAPVRDLTEKMLEGALSNAEVEIQDQDGKDGDIPTSMTPARLATTNRPPSAQDLLEIHRAMKAPGVPVIQVPEAEPDAKNESTDGEKTVYCAEQDKD